MFLPPIVEEGQYSRYQRTDAADEAEDVWVAKRDFRFPVVVILRTVRDLADYDEKRWKVEKE